MLLFDPSLSSVFWNVLSYSVIQAYSVCDFEKCTTLFRYFSLLCYLELRSTSIHTSVFLWFGTGTIQFSSTVYKYIYIKL